MVNLKGFFGGTVSPERIRRRSGLGNMHRVPSSAVLLLVSGTVSTSCKMRLIELAAGESILVNGDGTGLVQLTFGPYAYFPTWSPDGSRIAYFQSQDFQQRLYLMKLDGSGEVPLTPAWALGVPSSPAAWRP